MTGTRQRRHQQLLRRLGLCIKCGRLRETLQHCTYHKDLHNFYQRMYLWRKKLEGTDGAIPEGAIR